MTAQEWLDELERLRKAATPGPWKHDKWIIKSLEARKIAQTINLDNSAYIVAACNAVPRLVEMVKYLSKEASGTILNANGELVEERTPDDMSEMAYKAMEPKE